MCAHGVVKAVTCGWVGSEAWEMGGEEGEECGRGLCVSCDFPILETSHNSLTKLLAHFRCDTDVNHILSHPGFVSSSDDRVTVALEELQDLKGVWSELSKVWEKIEDLREKPWLSVAPRKVRQELDALLLQLKGFPARLKTYASYEYVQNLLKSYTKVSRAEGESGRSQGQGVWEQGDSKVRGGL